MSVDDPADELRNDIESAIAEQESGGEPSQEKVEAPESSPSEKLEDQESEGSRERDEKGRFKPKAEEESARSELQKQPLEAKVEVEQPKVAETPQRPPPGFSVASKSIWENLPQHVRDDIAKRELEIDNGFKRYSGLGKFAEEAERNGTTLQNAVSDYVAVETELNKNFFGGIEYLCHRFASKLGVHPQELLAGLGRRYGASASDGQSEQQNYQPQQIDPRAIADYVTNVVRSEAQQREIDSQVEVFGADPKNKYFPNLRQDMAHIVQAGELSGKAVTLQQAYEAACWGHPEIRAILINEANGGKEKQAADKVSRSRAAAKAVSGPPASGVNPDLTDRKKNLSLDDEIRAAIASQEGAA